MARVLPSLMALFLASLGAACVPMYDHAGTPRLGAPLREVARFDEQPTGVAVSRTGRVFVSFPNWWSQPRDALVEVLGRKRVRSFPDERWNRWNGEEGEPAQTSFVCVQSVQIDRTGGTMWVLDTGRPLRIATKLVRGGPKLVRIDLAHDRVERVIRFDERVAPPDSYLNDVQVDRRTNHAYLTDSELGALVVVDLTSGHARRVLERSPATKAEPGVVPRVGGVAWTTLLGTSVPVHADGIALDASGDWLYFRALSARTQYRIRSSALRDPTLPSAMLERSIERVAHTSAADGLAIDEDGVLYLTALEHDAIERLGPRGTPETVARDPRIQWPDSIAIWRGPREDFLFFTTSQIHLTWPFNGTDVRKEPFGLFAVTLPRTQR